MRGHIVLMASLLLIGCDEPQPPARMSNPSEALDPRGNSPLSSLGDADAFDALAYAGFEINFYRAKGVEEMIDALGKALGYHVDTSVLDKIDDRYIGAPLTRWHEQPAGEYGGNRYGLRATAVDETVEQFEDCPLLAPETNDGTRCNALVDTILVKVNNAIEEDEIVHSARTAYSGLPDESLAFIASWAYAAQQYGAAVAAIYAKQELRASGQCDNKENAQVIARNLGRKQGVTITEQYLEWAERQLQSCVINTDIIAERVRQMTRHEISGFMKEHVLCEGVDISATNAVLERIEREREEGIREGIEERVEVLRKELLEKSRDVACDDPEFSGARGALPACELAGGGTASPSDDDASVLESGATDDASVDAATNDAGVFEETGVSEGTGACNVGATCDLVGDDGTWELVDGNCVCCRYRNQYDKRACKGPSYPPVYCGSTSSDDSMSCGCAHLEVGSPLVIDLDDDGLQLSSDIVSFDLLDAGSKQRCTWVAETEAFVVLDHDGDGSITSSRELFGNKTRCGDHACYDGVVALKQWDDPARGGNGDGMLDRHDLVFGRLQLWLDRNHDGLSQPGELQPLDAVGVRAFQLDAIETLDRRAEGIVTATLDVLTDGGFRRAYDVWFKMQVTKAELPFLRPR